MTPELTIACPIVAQANFATDAFRLALSHNTLQTLPTRISECKRLRYLNVRYNALREFPSPVRQLI
jgi:Leucine-rich repeat (LRR) protein